MRIFHIDRQHSWTGQINRLFNVANGASDRGHEAGIIASPGSQLAFRSREAGLNVQTFPMRAWQFYPSILRVARYLHGKRVDILHCHGARDHVLSLIAARLASVKHVVRTKHNHNRLKSGCLSRFLYRKCSKVVAVSEYTKQLLIEDGIAGTHVETIYTGVDIDRFKPRPKVSDLTKGLKIAEEEFVVGCVSSLHVRKGIEETLRAFKILRDALPGRKIRCLLVGKKWQRWAALAEELGIRDQVIFTGFRRDVADLLSLLDIYVLPSRDEGLGTSIIEAMAMGLPVVASNVGGIPEAVTKESGVIVPPGNPDSLAEALKRLVEDNQRRKALGKAASERARTEFSVKRLIDRTVNLYERLLEEG
jgi:glycosyltransferase involved in cell wall biosynthesis